MITKSRQNNKQNLRQLTAVILWAILCLGCQASAQTVVLYNAHAHNDYEHDRPLLEALERGFMSIEVDIFLIDGELLVAHDLEDVSENRTLESLYLKPLKEHIEKNDGQVYDDASDPLILLVDVKSEAESTYRVLREKLEPYHSMLTRFNGDSMTPAPVMIVISGNRARTLMQKEDTRWAAYDGRLEDLEGESLEPASFIPLISSNWNAVASWYGRGELSNEAREKLRRIVELTHQQGRKLRFWATSDSPVVWQELYDAGVDFLNADDLAGLQQFLIGRR